MEDKKKDLNEILDAIEERYDAWMSALGIAAVFVIIEVIVKAIFIIVKSIQWLSL